MKDFLSRALFALLAVAAVSASPAFADDATTPSQPSKFLVADDSSSQTYKQMFGQIAKFCSTDQFVIQEIDNKGGAQGNFQALLDNKAQAVFVHSDVLVAEGHYNETYRVKYKTLLALYGEDIHIVTLRNSSVTEGALGFGKLSVGGTTKEFNALSDFNGYKIGAAGGGIKTIKLLVGEGGAGFTPVEFDRGSDLLPALDNGTVQAVVFVGGAPLPNLMPLTDKYKLVRVDDSFASRLKSIYRPSQISYTNLKASNVQTLAAIATIVTRVYKTPKFVEQQRALRNCFYS